MGVAWFNYRPTRKMYIVVKAGEGKPTLEYLPMLDIGIPM